MSGVENKVIEVARLWNNVLELVFVDGTSIKFFDACTTRCTTRYSITDSGLGEFTGAKFFGHHIDQRASSRRLNDGYAHEQETLVVETSIGEITCTLHAVHNRYCEIHPPEWYGGFDLTMEIQ